MQNKERHRRTREKEAAFLLAFYRKDSPTRLDRRASAITAGFPVARAIWSANRILDKYADTPFKECAETVGITKPQMAVMLSEFMETSEGKDKLASIRLMMSNMGEQTDSASIQKNVNINAPVMVIQGMTPAKLEALRTGGASLRAKAERSELPPAPEQDALDAETIEEPASIETAPAETPDSAAPDARKLPVSDFSGTNLTASARRKGPSY